MRTDAVRLAMERATHPVTHTPHRLADPDQMRVETDRSYQRDPMTQGYVCDRSGHHHLTQSSHPSAPPIYLRLSIQVRFFGIFDIVCMIS